MRLKDEVMELLRQGSESALAELVAADRRAVRLLMARLWDTDEVIRRRAARAIGRAAAVHADLGTSLIRRLMWALNDESATNGVHGLAALGEIGRQAPERLAPFLASLASMACDDGLRLELLRAFEAVAESSPDLVKPHVPDLEQHVDYSRPEEREALHGLAEATGTRVANER